MQKFISYFWSFHDEQERKSSFRCCVAKEREFYGDASIISCYVWFLVVDWRDKQLCLRGGTSFKVPSAPISYFAFREELSHISRDRQWPCRSCWWYISFFFPRMLMCLTKKKRSSNESGIRSSQENFAYEKVYLCNFWLYLLEVSYVLFGI